MSKYLIRTTEQYRVDSEAEAKQLIESAKNERGYTLNKYSSEWKATKVKGEVADEWLRVILVKDFTAEKEPDKITTINYDVDFGSFPTVDSSDEDEDDEESPWNE